MHLNSDGTRKKKKKKKKTRRVPANGREFIGLIVGGDEKLVNSYKNLVAKHGIILKYEWHTVSRISRVPSDTEVVLVVMSDNRFSRKERERFIYNTRENYFVVEARFHKDVSETLARAGFVVSLYSSPPLPVAEYVDSPARPIVAPVLPPAVVPSPPIIVTSPPPPPPPAVKPLKSPLVIERDADIVEVNDMMKTPNFKDLSAEQVGLVLQEFRLLKRYSVKQVAEKLGVSTGTVYAIEGARTPLTNNTASIFEQLYELDHDTLPRSSRRRFLPNPESQPQPELQPHPPQLPPQELHAQPPPPQEQPELKTPPPLLQEQPELKTPPPLPQPSEAPVAQGPTNDLTEEERFFVDVVRIRATMKRLGIARIEMTPLTFIYQVQEP